MSGWFDQPPVVGALISAGVAFLAAFASLVIGLVNWRQSRQSFSSSVEERVNDLYDRLMEYRLKHPEVFRLSRSWTPDCISKIYSQVNDEERAWAIYFGYIELCISFCNATLHANNRRRLDKSVYKKQLEPLVRLLVTEHFPAISQLTQEGFASATIAEYIREKRKSGWDFEAKYESMDKVK